MYSLSNKLSWNTKKTIVQDIFSVSVLLDYVELSFDVYIFASGMWVSMLLTEVIYLESSVVDNVPCESVGTQLGLETVICEWGGNYCYVMV